MRRILRFLRVCTLLSALSTTACVIVPFPAYVDDVRGAASVDAELDVTPGEAIAVIGERGVKNDEGYPVCVSDELQQLVVDMGLDVRVIEASEFQQELYPWFDPQRRPESIGALKAVLVDPTLSEKLESTGLRYLVYVHEESSTEELTGPALPHLAGGVASLDIGVGLVADVWDLEHGRSLGSVHVDASGQGGFVGFGFYGVWMRPTTGSAACTAMGQALAAVVAGASVDDVVEGLAEKRSLKAAQLRASADEGSTTAAIELAREHDDAGPLRLLAGQGDVAAAIALARLYDETESLEAMAEQGNTEAAIQLARATGDLGPLKALAREGDRQAAKALGLYFNDLSALKALAAENDLDAAMELALDFDDDAVLRALAESGGAAAAFAVYSIRSEGGRGAVYTHREAWAFLCLAASRGHGPARNEIAYWHRPDIWSGLSTNRMAELSAVGVRSDNRIAYMWYTLAIIIGDEYAADTRGYVAATMTIEKIAEAETMAGVWIPGDCPSAEHRLETPGAT